MHRMGLRLAFLTLFGVLPLAAQRPVSSGTSNTPLGEVSLNYAYVLARTVNQAGCCFNAHGGNVSVSVNLNEWLALVQDFGGYYAGNIHNSGLTLRLFSYTAGPRISMNKSGRLTPFVQGLFGGAHAGGTLYTRGFQQGSAPPQPQDSFAMILGGGLDVNVSRNFAIRTVQADWFFTKFPNGKTNRQHNLRITTGVVFRFGSR